MRLHANTDVSTAFIIAPSTDLTSISLCDSQMLFPQVFTAGRSKPIISFATLQDGPFQQILHGYAGAVGGGTENW